MSGVRVTYSGLIAFFIGILSVITGLIFTLILTRQLSQEDFGVWALIGSLTGYVLIFNSMIYFWATREIARGKDTGKTSFLSSSLLSVVAVVIYVIIVSFFQSDANIDKNVLYLAAILIPAEFIRVIFVSINMGFRPHIANYGILIFETTKITFGVFLVYFLDFGIEGVILTVSLSALVSATFLGIKTREKLKGYFKKKYLRYYLKYFWIPSYPNLAAILTTSDVVVFTLMTGSIGGVAFWSACRAVSRIVHHSLRINQAVYPKLLAGGKNEYFEKNLHYVFYFAFPLVGISIIFAEPALFALNPIYREAFPIIFLLSPLFFLRSLTEIFEGSLKGTEKVDTRKDATFIDYIKSKLFFLPTLRNIQRGGYIVALLLFFLFLNIQEASQLELVMYWAIIALVTQIPYSIYLGKIARKEFRPKLEKLSITKYFMSSLVAFGITFLLMEKAMIYHTSILKFLPELFQYLILGSCIYFGITYLIDLKTRKLFRAIFAEVLKK